MAKSAGKPASPSPKATAKQLAQLEKRLDKAKAVEAKRSRKAADAGTKVARLTAKVEAQRAASAASAATASATLEPPAVDPAVEPAAPEGGTPEPVAGDAEPAGGGPS